MGGRDMQDQKAKETKPKSKVISNYNAPQKIKMTGETAYKNRKLKPNQRHS